MKTLAIMFVFMVLTIGGTQVLAQDVRGPVAEHTEVTVEHPERCALCGMNRTRFAHSRMLIEYSDGGSTGTCSVNCAVRDLEKNSGKTIKRIQVGDYNTKQLIDAKTAQWVMGGSKKGVMTRNPKWAFTNKDDADTFIAEFGGKRATFDEVVVAVKSELREWEARRAAKEAEKAKNGGGMTHVPATQPVPPLRSDSPKAQ